MRRHYTNVTRETYQPSGRELRVYWDEQPHAHEIMDGEFQHGYSYAEAVLLLTMSPEEMRAGILAVDPNVDADALVQGWLDQ